MKVCTWFILFCWAFQARGFGYSVSPSVSLCTQVCVFCITSCLTVNYSKFNLEKDRNLNFIGLFGAFENLSIAVWCWAKSNGNYFDIQPIA